MDPFEMMEEIFESEAALVGFFGAFVVIWLVLVFVLLAWSIVNYVFGSLGIYQIAKRRGIHNPWLAWLPVGNAWVLGSISDHYQYVRNGKTRSFRKVLLWMQAGILGVSLLSCVVSIVTSFGSVMGAAVGSDAAMVGSLGMSLVNFMLSMVVSVASIVFSVFAYICYYDVFQSCKPKNAVLFLVLSIVLGVTLPFFLFACRKADEGMPPKIRSRING